MNINNQRSFVITALVVLLFASMSACAKKTVPPAEQESAMVEKAAGEEQAKEMVEEEPMAADEGMGEAEPLSSEVVVDTEAEPLEGRTTPGLFPVYFDFDRSVIRSDQIERMEKNASFMKDNLAFKVRVEGNCDERGTNEYNMALGQRRAMSGKKYLVNLGVSPSRLDTISYGEERPINRGHDELSWSQNRRDDFVVMK